MVIKVEGEKTGDKLKYTLTRGGTEASTDEKLQMFRRLGTTRVGVAAPAIVGAKMCIKGNAETGVISPECFDPIIFLRMMTDMGVPVKFQETVSKSVTVS